MSSKLAVHAFIGHIRRGCHCGRPGAWIVVLASRGLGNDRGAMSAPAHGFVMTNWAAVVMGEVRVL